MDVMALPWELIIGGLVSLAGIIFGRKKARQAKQNRKAAQTMAEAIYETDSKAAARRVKAKRVADPTIGSIVDEIVEAAGVNLLKKTDAPD